MLEVASSLTLGSITKLWSSKQDGAGRKQTHRSVEQNREARNKSTHLWLLYLQKNAGIYSGEKTVSPLSIEEKTRQLHVKE